MTPCLAPASKVGTGMEAALYEVGVRGRLGPTIASALDGFEVVSCDGRQTRLRGWIADQSSLYGVIELISSLGLELISVLPVDEG
jgi:hypothetical protein